MEGRWWMRAPLPVFGHPLPLGERDWDGELVVEIGGTTGGAPALHVHSDERRDSNETAALAPAFCALGLLEGLGVLAVAGDAAGGVLAEVVVFGAHEGGAVADADA